MNESPRYATLLYDVRKCLGVSIPEYFYLDMVYFLSRKTGWCFKSLEAIADDMGMQKSGVAYMRDRLIKKGYLERNKKGDVRTTDRYEEIAIINRGSVHSVNKPAEKRSLSEHGRSLSEQERSLSGTKNNNRNTLELGDDLKLGKEKPDYRGLPSPAKERVRQLLKQKQGLLT